MRDGLAKVDQLLSRRKRKGRAEAALHRGRSAHRRDPRDGRRPLLQPVAVQPRGRRRAGSRARCSSRSSTWRRSSRPPRSGAADLTPASIVDDEPTTWEFDDQVWTPENYEKTTTARSRCGARWRCRATSPRSRSPSRPASTAWRRCGSKLGVGTTPQGVSVDRARRVRGDAARDRDGLHDLPEPGHDAAAAHICCASSAAPRRDDQASRRSRNRSRGPTRRSW